MKLNLNHITICAADCLRPNLTVLALKKSMQECQFADAILFSDQEISDSEIRLTKIGKLNSKDAYSKFILKELNQYIQTPFALIIQWDGYVITPTAWKNSFLNFDYIGAKWPWRDDAISVGNGGFSLRSKKLLDAMASTNFPFLDAINEDNQICINYRNRLIEEHSIKIAPEAIADEFSYERSDPNQQTFGFHGLFNMWRYTADEEMVEIVNQLPGNVLLSVECFELLAQYFLMRKFIPLASIYLRLKKALTNQEIEAKLLQMTNNQEFVNTMLLVCESLASNLKSTSTP